MLSPAADFGVVPGGDLTWIKAPCVEGGSLSDGPEALGIATHYYLRFVDPLKCKLRC
jgi:hypothetical protein